MFTDKEKPQFTDCQNIIYVWSYEAISGKYFNVTDNSGALKSLAVAYNLRRPVTNDMTLTWNAEDHAGNKASPCAIKVHVKGKSICYAKCC